MGHIFPHCEASYLRVHYETCVKVVLFINKLNANVSLSFVTLNVVNTCRVNLTLRRNASWKEGEGGGGLRGGEKKSVGGGGGILPVSLLDVC